MNWHPLLLTGLILVAAAVSLLVVGLIAMAAEESEQIKAAEPHDHAPWWERGR